MARYIDSRRFGDITVTVIDEGSGLYHHSLDVPESEWRPALPDVDERGMARFGQNVVHIRAGEASILVDAGLDDPGSAWDRKAAEENEAWERSPGLVAGLAAIGVRPQDITHVLITHAHFDHIVGAAAEQNGRYVARYPNARYLLGRAEWEGNPQLEELESDIALRLASVDRLGQLDLVDGDLEIAPGVTMIHAPGESPGHSIIRVSSDDETCFVLGDIFHQPAEVEHLDWGPPWADMPTLHATRERIVADALSSSATLVFAHALFPPWGRIVPANGGYRWQPD
jgi:glyoxylase-like metal-dependent hydrolase (beta-lactamase superfamily II)